MVKLFNLAFRFFLELFTLGTLGYWGFKFGNSPISKNLLMIAIPLIIAVAWGIFGAPRARVQLSVPLHLLLEWVIFFVLPTFALYFAGRHNIAIIYGVVFIINSFLIYILGKDIN